MKIFEENGKIRLQLAKLEHGLFDEMLFDFTVEKEEFEELRDHIIEHFLAYKIE